MKRFLPVVLVAIAAIGWNHYNSDIEGSTASAGSNYGTSVDRNWHSGQQVQSGGEVIRVLPDDNDGSRHQRFIVRINSGRTLLIAHNIDLAPRVPLIREGDTVSFNGEYEWNDKGGVVHWTHRDPQNQHQAGWIEHQGKRYQ